MKKYLIVIICLIMCNNVYAYDCESGKCVSCFYSDGNSNNVEIIVDPGENVKFYASYNDNDITYLVLDKSVWYFDMPKFEITDTVICRNEKYIREAINQFWVLDGSSNDDISNVEGTTILPFTKREENGIEKENIPKELQEKINNINNTSNNSKETKVEGCPLGEDVTKDISGLLKVIKIVVPLMVVALSTWDMIKTIASGDAQTGMKKQAIRFGKRIAAAIVLFFIPVLVNQLMILLNVWDEDGGCEVTGSRVVNKGNEKTTQKLCEILGKESCSLREDCTIYKGNCVKKCGYYSNIRDCPTDRCQVTGSSTCSPK